MTTPLAVIAKLNAVVQNVLDDATLMKRTPQAAQALFKSEIARWGEVVRENRIQPVD